MQLPEIDFSDLDYTEIGTWPLVLRAPVIVVACVVAVVIVYFLVLQPQLTVLDQQVKQLDDKKKDFKDKFGIAANLDAYKQQMVQMQGIYTEFLKELPATNNVPELIDNVTKLATSDGVKIVSVKIGDPVAASGFYMELPISLVVSGTYNGFGKFVSDVEKLARIVTIQDFSIKPSVSVTQSQGEAIVIPTDQLTMNIETKTYWLASESDQETGKKNLTPNATLTSTPATNPNPAATPPPPPSTTGVPVPSKAPPGFVGVPNSPPGTNTGK